MTKIDLQTLVDWRREIHAFPEIGWAEFVTTAKIIEALEGMGHKVLTGKDVIHPGFIRGRNKVLVEQAKIAAKERGVSDAMLARIGDYTGCAMVMDTGRPGPVLALRADIDCVNVTETQNANHPPAKGGYASTNPGYMHACGHDGHVAIMLGVAQWLADHRDQLKGKVKILFQPAEEGVRGARPMAESGILDDVDYFASGHLGCDVPSGTVVAAPEKFYSTIKMDLRFKGKPAHAGMAPHQGKNALAAACSAATQILGISRHGEGPTLVNVGVLRAGEGRNVIPAFAEMQIEVRGGNEKINTYMADEAIRRAKGAALGFDVELETEIMGEAVDFVADDEMTEHVKAVAQTIPAIKTVQHTILFNGSEDATLLVKRVQSHGGKAAYVMLGADIAAGHHQAEFDFDEQQLWTGYEFFTGLVKRLLG